MKRRTFLQIALAATAAPFRGAAQIKLVPRPRKIEVGGYTFIEDSDPLRFIVTPDGYEAINPETYQRETLGIWWPEPETKLILGSNAGAKLKPNPAWQNASHELDPEFSPYPLPRTYLDALRQRTEGVPVITSDLIDVLRRPRLREDQRRLDRDGGGTDPALAARQEPSRDQSHPAGQRVEVRVADSARCPTCGLWVPSVFEHVDLTDCPETGLFDSWMSELNRIARLDFNYQQPMSDIPAWRAYYDEGCSPRAALLEDERNA